MEELINIGNRIDNHFIMKACRIIQSEPPDIHTDVKMEDTDKPDIKELHIVVGVDAPKISAKIQVRGGYEGIISDLAKNGVRKLTKYEVLRLEVTMNVKQELCDIKTVCNKILCECFNDTYLVLMPQHIVIRNGIFHMYKDRYRMLGEYQPNIDRIVVNPDKATIMNIIMEEFDNPSEPTHIWGSTKML